MFAFAPNCARWRESANISYLKLFLNDRAFLRNLAQPGAAPRFVFAGKLDDIDNDDLISVNDLSALPLQKRGPSPMDIEALLTVFPVLCAADINGDGAVDSSDIGILIGQFGQSGTGLPSDLNGDNVVNSSDSGIWIGEFGSTCS